jgi:hypothetical protein
MSSITAMNCGVSPGCLAVSAFLPLFAAQMQFRDHSDDADDLAA